MGPQQLVPQQLAPQQLAPQQHAPQQLAPQQLPAQQLHQPQQVVQQQQQQQQHQDYNASSSSSSTPVDSGSGVAGSAFSSLQQYSNFGANNHWPNYTNTYPPTHSPVGQYPSSNSYHPNPYFSSNSNFTYPQVQPNYPNMSNYHQYGNNFTPGYSPHPYPGSFSQ